MNGKLKVLIEVAVIFLLVLIVPIILLDHFGGRTYTIICCIMWFTIVMVFLIVTKKDLSRYGISLRNPGTDLKIVALCIIPVNASILTGILLPIPNPGPLGSLLLNLIISVLMILVVGKILGSISLKSKPSIVEKATLSSLVVLPAVLLLVVAGFSTLATPLAFSFILFFVFVGPAEELVYRGYMQSRLNEAFGRPWHFFGISLGAGLIISTLLFGFAHVLNYTFNPLSGNYSLDWQWGLGAFLNGLILAIVREKAGSIVAPSILHASYDFAPYLSGFY